MKDIAKEQVIEQINRSKDIYKLYSLYKKSFIAYAFLQYQIENEDAEEIFQESFIILYQKLRNNVFINQNVSLKTYLFGIGKKRIYKYFEKKGRKEKMLRNLSEEWVEENYDSGVWNQAQDVARALVMKDAGSCNKILQLFYWEKKSMADIAGIMGYKTEQVAKNKKSSCLRRLGFELRKRLSALGIDWK